MVISWRYINFREFTWNTKENQSRKKISIEYIVYKRKQFYIAQNYGNMPIS